MVVIIRNDFQVKETNKYCILKICDLIRFTDQDFQFLLQFILILQVKSTRLDLLKFWEVIIFCCYGYAYTIILLSYLLSIIFLKFMKTGTVFWFWMAGEIPYPALMMAPTCSKQL